jgi:hypothetical protein
MQMHSPLSIIAGMIENPDTGAGRHIPDVHLSGQQQAAPLLMITVNHGSETCIVFDGALKYIDHG